MRRPAPRYRTRLEYDVHRGMIRSRAQDIAELPVIVGSPEYFELLELTADFMALDVELERFGPEIERRVLPPG